MRLLNRAVADATTRYRDQVLANVKVLSLDGYKLLIGPNWVDNSPQVESIYKKLGGTLATK